MLVLASSSLARKSLLVKLGLDFKVVEPNIDETIFTGETPTDAVYRLAQQKAYAVANNTDGLIIASDQIALLDETILTKPLNHQNATWQLQQCSGKKVVFLTSLALLNTKSQNIQTIVEKTSVYFRKLHAQQIEKYLQQEQPYQCAGSFKSEAMGIILFNKISSRDPNTLIGLPIMALVDMLIAEGISL